MNTIIGNMFDKKLSDKISEINRGQDIRNFDFSLLTEVIEKYELFNYYE